MNRRLVFIVAVAAAVVGGLVAAPRRYEVDGISMGPGLLPGDVVATGWLPAADRWRSPKQFDRWIVQLPDGSTGLKRLVGLPGEEVAFVAGDLAIAGEVVRKGPRQLDAIGSRVPEPSAAGRSWSRPAAVVLDDAPFATAEVARLLAPVRDVGLAAVVRVAAGPARVRAAVGPLAVRWRLAAQGRYVLVAGRLDGQAVAVAWPLSGDAAWRADRSGCLPPGAPDRWDVERPWPAGDGPDAVAEEAAPDLRLEIEAADERAVVESVNLWRDILYRPAADGVTRWPLGGDEFFLLGDFPSGSRDSRHFGPLPRSALRHRLSEP